MARKSIVTVSAAALLCAAALPTLSLAQGAPADPQLAQMWGGPCGGYGPGWMGQGQGRGYGYGYGQGQGQGQGWGMRRGPGWAGGGAPVDLDQDGVVVAEEAAAHAEQRFALLDLDGDDVVSEDEFMEAAPAHRRMRPWGGAQRMYRFRTERFKEFDADEDGSVSRAEFIGSAQAAFERADSDGDGKVTVWEFRAERRPR